MRKLLPILIVAVCSTNSFAYYQAQQGRWVSRDPIGEEGGINLYANSLNNPANRIDPFGLSSDSCSATVRAGHYTDRNKNDHGYDRKGNKSHSNSNHDGSYCYAGCGMNDLNDGITDYHDNPDIFGDPTFTNGHEDVYDISSAMDAAEDAAVEQICNQKDENGCPECDSATIYYDCDPHADDFRCSVDSMNQKCENNP